MTQRNSPPRRAGSPRAGRGAPRWRRGRRGGSCRRPGRRARARSSGPLGLGRLRRATRPSSRRGSARRGFPRGCPPCDGTDRRSARRRGDTAPRSRAPGSRRGRPPPSARRRVRARSPRAPARPPERRGAQRSPAALPAGPRAARRALPRASRGHRARPSSEARRDGLLAGARGALEGRQPRGTPASALVSASPPPHARPLDLLPGADDARGPFRLGAGEDVRMPPHELVRREPGRDADVEGALVLRHAAEGGVSAVKTSPASAARAAGGASSTASASS